METALQPLIHVPSGANDFIKPFDRPFLKIWDCPFLLSVPYLSLWGCHSHHFSRACPSFHRQARDVPLTS